MLFSHCSFALAPSKLFRAQEPLRGGFFRSRRAPGLARVAHAGRAQGSILASHEAGFSSFVASRARVQAANAEMKRLEQFRRKNIHFVRDEYFSSIFSAVELYVPVATVIAHIGSVRIRIDSQVYCTIW